jgi:hypothetical protein
MTNNIYVTHLYLDKAAKAALVAHHSEGVAHEHQLRVLRDWLIAALSRCEASFSVDAEALLRDMIENALTDSMDQDWTVGMGAEAVMKALFDFHEGDDQ